MRLLRTPHLDSLQTGYLASLARSLDTLTQKLASKILQAQHECLGLDSVFVINGEVLQNMRRTRRIT